MDMKELLAIDDLTKRNTLLKRAFNFATLPIAIDGFEQEAIIILLNITIKREKVSDVLSTSHAKQVLADSLHIEKCLSTLSYIQTHNLKYPDTRCRGVIRVLDNIAYPNGFISVEGFRQFDWSHNAADINRCLLFGASFVLNGDVTTLFNELAKENNKLSEILAELGMEPRIVSRITKYAEQLLSNEFPQSVENAHIKQVRIINPDKEYIAVTPVAPYLLQRDIHLACKQKAFKFTVINHAHPASIGGFTAACGGKVRVLYYPPRFLNHSLELLQEPAEFLEKEHWQQLFKYLELHEQVTTFAIRQKVQTEFHETLSKLLLSWLTAHQAREDLTTLSHQFHHWLSTFNFGQKLAYHPQLLQPVVNELKQIMQSQTPKTPEDATYLILPNLTVSNANAMASPYLCGVPALNAFDGFITNCLRRLSTLLDEQIGHESFAVCFHQFTLLKNSIKRELEPKSAKRFATPSVQDDRSAHFAVSLVIKLNKTVDIDKPRIFAALPARLAGGVIHLPITQEQNVKIVNAASEAVSCVSFNKQGSWLVDDRANFDLKGEPAAIAQLQTYLADNYDATPVIAGMALLEQTKTRPGRFGELPHAFAEPLLTVAKWKSKITFNQLDALFWKRNWQNNSTYFGYGQLGGER